MNTDKAIHIQGERSALQGWYAGDDKRPIRDIREIRGFLYWLLKI